MARICDACRSVVEQDEVLHVMIYVVDPEEGVDQDAKEQAYGDFCDGCVATGAAVASLLKRIEWTLEPKDDVATVLAAEISDALAELSCVSSKEQETASIERLIAAVRADERLKVRDEKADAEPKAESRLDA